MRKDYHYKSKTPNLNQTKIQKIKEQMRKKNTQKQ